MTSSVSWLDHSEADQQRVRDLLQMFTDKATVDDLGFGTIRDAISNQLFPGTSVIQTRANAVHPSRTEIVVLQILFASPHDLDRRSHGFREVRRFRRVVDHEASPEPAATALHVNRDVRDRYADDSGSEVLRVSRILRGPPQLDTITADVGRVVHGLHRHVSDERNLVDDIE